MFPAPVNLTAFESRLSAICSMRSLSPQTVTSVPSKSHWKRSPLSLAARVNPAAIRSSRSESRKGVSLRVSFASLRRYTSKRLFSRCRICLHNMPILARWLLRFLRSRVSIASSALPLMMLSGARMSWEIVRMIFLRISSRPRFWPIISFNLRSPASRRRKSRWMMTYERISSRIATPSTQESMRKEVCLMSAIRFSRKSKAICACPSSREISADSSRFNCLFCRRRLSTGSLKSKVGVSRKVFIWLFSVRRFLDGGYIRIVSFLPKNPAMPFLRRISMRGLLALLTTVGSCWTIRLSIATRWRKLCMIRSRCISLAASSIRSVSTCSGRTKRTHSRRSVSSRLSVLRRLER